MLLSIIFLSPNKSMHAAFSVVTHVYFLLFHSSSLISSLMLTVPWYRYGKTWTKTYLLNAPTERLPIHRSIDSCGGNQHRRSSRQSESLPHSHTPDFDAFLALRLQFQSNMSKLEVAQLQTPGPSIEVSRKTKHARRTDERARGGIHACFVPCPSFRFHHPSLFAARCLS